MTNKSAGKGDKWRKKTDFNKYWGSPIWDKLKENKELSKEIEKKKNDRLR